MRQLRRQLALVLYYAVARHLPESYSFLDVGCRWLRGRLVQTIFDAAGQDLDIQKGVSFGRGRGIRVGSHSGIGISSHLQGPLTIGNFVMIGPETIVYTRGHQTKDLDVPMGRQGDTTPRPVIIGDDIWIGTRVIILPGVHIGSHSIIGAGAVVTHDIPEYAVAAGTPARVIKDRRDS